MCGIAGIWLRSGVERERLCRLAGDMADALAYRGPDDCGVWLEESAGLALGHRRLSILDLSAEGNQPMLSPSGRFVISYNGEVYNSVELRRELEPAGFRFRGHSDTEVMLAAMEAWGVEFAVKRFIGMFAFALWDRRDHELILVRDRLGIKPLYYGRVGGDFAFASELKALRACPGFDNAVNRDALTLYLRHNYIPGPYSIYQDIYKLLPGTLLKISADQIRSKVGTRELSQQATAFWSARQMAQAGQTNRFTGSFEDAAAELDGLLRDAVRLRMVADVPLGAFLSGGVDSSTVVALMQAQSPRPVKTFSIGFREVKYDEAAHARRVAQHLGTDHTELYVTPKEALAVVPLLPAMYDEPFADSSQIPTYLVSKLARNTVKVSLSGDGGDELFAGYDRYFRALGVWRKIGWLPRFIRGEVGGALERGSVGTLKLAAAGLRFLPGLGRDASADRLRKLGGMLASASRQSLYREFLSHWRTPAAVTKAGHEPDYFLTDESNWAVSSDAIENMCFADTNTYLPDDILTKVDRASMAVSLEARVPLLDHRVVELAWRVPMHMKIRNGKNKWLLRQVLYKYVPPELIERPKMGFGVPIDEWLKGPLREWAESLLSEERLKREGFFNPEPIRTKWREHLSGKHRWHYHLWDVLMFQAWWESQADRCTSYAMRESAA